MLENLVGASQFCPSYKKVESRVTFLTEKDKIFASFFKILSQNVNNFEGWSINLYHGVEEFVRWITILFHISESLWQGSKVCLTMSKDLWGELQFCHTVLKKIAALITIFSHDDIFVSCNKVLFRSVNISERGIKTMFIVSKVLWVNSKICFTVPETLRRESPFCLTVKQNLWFAPQFCPCFLKLCVHSQFFVWRWQTSCELLKNFVSQCRNFWKVNYKINSQCRKAFEVNYNFNPLFQETCGDNYNFVL